MECSMSVYHSSLDSALEKHALSSAACLLLHLTCGGVLKSFNNVLSISELRDTVIVILYSDFNHSCGIEWWRPTVYCQHSQIIECFYFIVKGSEKCDGSSIGCSDE